MPSSYYGISPEQDQSGLLPYGTGFPEFAGGTFSGEQASVAGINKPFWAQLTSSGVSAGVTYYAWTEQVFDSSGGGTNISGFTALPGGRFGTTTASPAREPNGARLATPIYVRLQWAYFDPTLGEVFLVTTTSADKSSKAGWILFTLVATLNTTDATQANVTVNAYWGGVTPGGTVTLYNLPASSGFIFSGASGKKGAATYDDVDDRYYIIQLEC